MDRKAAGNKAQSTEDIKAPKSLGFLRDTSVAMSLTMVILVFIVAPFAGKEFIEKQLNGGVNFLVFSLMQGITFATGVYVVLAGVRMLISEIVPAFKGIEDKVVQDAKPSLDCPAVFPYAPNAVIVGLKVIVPWLIPGPLPAYSATRQAADEAPFLERLPTEFSSRSYRLAEYGTLGGLALLFIICLNLVKYIHLFFPKRSKKCLLDSFLLGLPIIIHTGVFDEPLFSPQLDRKKLIII